jgi:hypothetical protein
MSDLHYFDPTWVTPTDRSITVDVAIYGGTSAGIIAAVECVKRGKSVVVVHPGKFIGGLTAGGLGWTDFGKKHVIGGLSYEFYRRVGKHYSLEEEWQFEPHVATAVYEALVKEHNIALERCQFLDKVEMDGKRIKSITLLGGLRVSARMFIDCTYEGDLMAKAGVSYHVGREANSVYNETLNGIQVREHHQFSHAVDPYVEPGDASSGLLPWVIADDLSKKQGEGDKRVQAYCFRMCMTDDPALKIDWEKPQGYDEREYELAARWFSGEKNRYNDQLPGPKGQMDVPNKFDVLPNRTAGGYRKTDTNNHGPVSSDFIGANHDWPEASYQKREEIFQRHVVYQKGFYWFMANSPRVPERYRSAYATWGLPKDEFTTCGHWPFQLYIREARRMIGDYVLNEHDCMHKQQCDDPVGMGSYNLDSHNCQRFVMQSPEGPRVMNDGDVQVRPAGPYAISYRCIVPKKGECENLFVPVCCSTSHIAYGSLRMEPVFMVLGQSAAIAAHLAIDGGTSVQDVKYPSLQKLLLDEKQVLQL